MNDDHLWMHDVLWRRPVQVLKLIAGLTQGLARCGYVVRSLGLVGLEVNHLTFSAKVDSVRYGSADIFRI